MKIDFPPLIAAVWDSKTDFERIRRYKGDTVFILKTDLISVQGQIKAYKKMSFRVFVDIDFLDGLSGDEYGFRFLKLQGLDGIITVKPRLIEVAKKYAYPAVLRSFALDSSALCHLHETILSYRPDIIEILPGCAFPKVIAYLREKQIQPFPVCISAGLVDDVQEVKFLIRSGAQAVSSSSEALWDQYQNIEREVSR